MPKEPPARCVALVIWAAVITLGWLSPVYAFDSVIPNGRVRQYVAVRNRTTTPWTAKGRLLVGEQAELLATQAQWYRVRLANGVEGFVPKYYTRVLAEEAEERRVGARQPHEVSLPAPYSGPGLTGIPTVAPGSHEMNIHLIDVGQGASTLYEFPCGAILIDTGSEDNDQFSGSEKLVAYLDRFFAGRPDLQNRLDLLLLSHAHVDHTRNAPAVIQRYNPKNLVDNGLTVGSGKTGQLFLQNWKDTHGTPYDSIEIGDVASGVGITDAIIDPVSCPSIDPVIRVLFGGLKQSAHCLSGWTQTDCKNGNNSSVVVRVDFGDFSTLESGDLEETGIDELRSRSEASGILDVDLYHVGHHGSRNGTTADLVAAMSPKLALISTGDSARKLSWSAWAYGHPNKQALGYLTDSSSGVSDSRQSVTVPVGVKGGTEPEWTEWAVKKAIYATGWDGNVVVHVDSDGDYQVVTGANQ